MFDASEINAKKNVDFSKLVEIPIGKNGGNVQSIKFSTTGDSAAHALVIGGTGSGKSNLLHALILSACYRYTPKELQIYLIDFKGGVEFKYYENNRLPHILLTGLTSEPEDGVAILTNIRAMLRERENIFRRNNVEDIVAYNELDSCEKMPRILVIIDEVQELFAHEKLSQQALTILGEIFKKGRAFGISILWASQTVPKTVGGDFKDKVLSQIGNRICLKLNNADDAEHACPEESYGYTPRPFGLLVFHSIPAT
jgi:DNA segregation ATPase FtsK/SpoIIIE-like protein